MEYKIDTSGEKFLIKNISIIIVFVIIIGAVIFFLNNPEYIYKYNMSKISDKVIDDICSDIDLAKQYSGNLYSNMDIKYNDRDLKIYFNKNVDNEYNTLAVNENLKIYESDGIYYVEIPEIQKAVQINKQALSIDLNSDVLNQVNTNDVKKIYNKFVKTFINEMNRDDFYRITYTYTNSKGKERKAYEFGIRISQERAKEIALNSLNKMLLEEKTLAKTDILIGQLNEDEKMKSKEIIENMIKNVSEFEPNKNVSYEVAIRNSGILNLKVNSIRALCLDSGKVIAEVNGTVNDGTTVLTIVDNINNITYNVNVTCDNKNTEIVFNFVDVEKKEYKFDYSISRYGVSRKTKLIANIGENSIYSECKIDGIEKENKLLSLFEKDKKPDIESKVSGETTLKILDKQYKYTVDGSIMLENKKDDKQLISIVTANNLTDEQLQLLGNYFEMDAQKIRQIVGDPDPINVDVNVTPENPGDGNVSNPVVQDPNIDVQPVDPNKPINLAR